MVCEQARGGGGQCSVSRGSSFHWWFCRDGPRSPRAQGQTCKEGVVMDMHIGEAGDPLTAYMTCFQDRHGLFVHRTFPAAPFQKGAKVGRKLLILLLRLFRFWDGEKMDWSTVQAKYRDERQCQNVMNQSRLLRSRLVDGHVQMREEYARNAFGGTWPWHCMACAAWKQEDAFMAKHARPQATFYRSCKTREQMQLCSVCTTRKDQNKFAAAAWVPKTGFLCGRLVLFPVLRAFLRAFACA